MLHKKVPQPVGCGTFWFAARGNRSGRVEYLLHAAPRGDFRHRSTNSGGAAMTSAALTSSLITAPFRRVSRKTGTLRVGSPGTSAGEREVSHPACRSKSCVLRGSGKTSAAPSGTARRRTSLVRLTSARSPRLARVTCPASPASFPPGLFLVSFPSFLPLSFPLSPCAFSRTAG